MTFVREAKNSKGLPLPNETCAVLTDQLPAAELITGAFVLAFREGELVLTNLYKRGWDIPGGHLEPGESPEDAMRRELYEEAGAVIDTFGLLGYERIRLLGPKPDGHPYPYPDSYMVFYWARVRRFEDIPGGTETFGRGLFDDEQTAEVPWVQSNQAFYEEARRRAYG